MKCLDTVNLTAAFINFTVIDYDRRRDEAKQVNCMKMQAYSPREVAQERNYMNEDVFSLN